VSKLKKIFAIFKALICIQSSCCTDLQGLESSKHALWRIVYYYTRVLFLEEQEEEEAKLENCR
jgi:hypothetical protein